jgi:hypothetical protein
MRFTDEQANTEYKTTINALIAKYGTSTRVPRDEWNEASETLRLRQTINVNGGKVTRHLLSQMMFPESIIRKVNPDFDGFEPKVKRADKYDSVYKWLDENPGTQVTTQELCDVSEMSYPTTLKFIDNNPQYFRKIKRGTYEVRNPKAEREAEK